MDKQLKTGLLTVVLPSSNEEASVPRAAQIITALLSEAEIRHELLFVDDGSRDKTWAAIGNAAICSTGIGFSLIFSVMT